MRMRRLSPLGRGASQQAREAQRPRGLEAAGTCVQSPWIPGSETVEDSASCEIRHMANCDHLNHAATLDDASKNHKTQSAQTL